ncbi:hypothetical protein [Prosthecobacter sp.]|uniref:hypothetical protein n=1 Tax=Prosthecobacter sp. TaxID=1965333 RepID=UPI00248879AB|nr:hypothetical protein [Prosthecobacter sp.]MDI1312867.1 hypothetical protein [Prosthecobacter sp.]
MSPHLIPNYRHTTELAADAMISEGGAIRQPTMRDAQAVYARLHTPCGGFSAALREWVQNPAAMFLTGLATGLALALINQKIHRDTQA